MAPSLSEQSLRALNRPGKLALNEESLKEVNSLKETPKTQLREEFKLEERANKTMGERIVFINKNKLLNKDNCEKASLRFQK